MKKFLAVLVSILFVFGLCACAESETGNVSDATLYRDAFWQEANEVRLFLNIAEEENTSSNMLLPDAGYALSEKDSNTISNLRNGITKFFLETYNIDVSEKLSQQKIRIFKQPTLFAGFTGGYITGRGDNGINLNVLLFSDSEYIELFESSYIHETMHYLGFASTNYNMLDEGITEAIAQKCAKYLNIEYQATPYYYYYQLAAEQLLVVNDKGIVEGYMGEGEFSITDHISKVLANVKKPYLQEDDIGGLLGLIITNLGIDYSDYGIYLDLTAQEIVAAYCKEFAPTQEQIDSIRQYYWIPEYEFVEITDCGNDKYYIEFQ